MSRSGVPGAEVWLREVTHLYQRQGEQVVALRDVYLHVEPGESVALLGPSGSGKSTLLSLLAGLQTPTTGEVAVDGRTISSRETRGGRKIRRDTVGLLVQDPATVLPPFATPYQLLRLARDKNPDRTLAVYGMRPKARQPVGTMSAGEQQRVALAVTMARRPALLLADEPTSRLDPDAKAMVVAALHETTREAGTTVIAVTHDRSVAETFPRTVTMQNGRVGSDGSATDQYAIVAPDGSLSLSPDALRLLPPGTRVRMIADAPHVRLSRGEGDEQS
jgi:ABC-type lipoprotein export system ATPase subunit